MLAALIARPREWLQRHVRELSGQSHEGLGWATGLPVEYVEAVEAGPVELPVRGLAICNDT